MDLKFRTKAACRIARIDPQRFNEDVASGEYHCAPETRAGVSRVFDEADIAGLLVYRHLMDVFGDRGFSKKTAAMYACGVIRSIREMKRYPDQTRADFPVDGFNDTPMLCRPEEGAYFGAHQHRALAATVCFDLSNILKAVRHGMSEEAKILGEED
ncbi:hypothetical protein [uncultured Roseobacter sp.]|uniref:hypothetical protein n=1 Tax=uncultured Roseobacter sp. TaxID=114847 RepID=UPI00262869FB|nr:hypothetical protein [uncultured Roseobacter sp.]